MCSGDNGFSDGIQREYINIASYINRDVTVKQNSLSAFFRIFPEKDLLNFFGKVNLWQYDFYNYPI